MGGTKRQTIQIFLKIFQFPSSSHLVVVEEEGKDRQQRCSQYSDRHPDGKVGGHVVGEDLLIGDPNGGHQELVSGQDL